MRFDSFKKAISHSPVILHLICHGGFNKKGEFFLEFESEWGELLEYSKEEIQHILR